MTKTTERRLAELNERVANLRSTLGSELRTRFVEPIFISAHNKFYYEAVDSKVVEKFESGSLAKNEANATNWTAFWAEDKVNKDFLYPDMVWEWVRFWWYTRAEFISWLTERGINRGKAVRMAEWRDTLIDFGGKKGVKRHRVYVLFCPVHAHKYLQKILSYFGNITTCAINGDTTSNLLAEAEINGHLDAWEFMRRPYDNGNEHEKFIILMGGMGNRSLSVKRITYAIMTGNHIGAAAYDQKTSRVRTEDGLDKVAVVLDLTLAHDGYSFNAKSLIDEYIRTHEGSVTQRKAFDIFAEGDNIVAYGCEADENGNYARAFTYSDYSEYVRRVTEGERLGSELNAILGKTTLVGQDRENIMRAATKAIEYLGGEDKVKNDLSYQPSSEVVGDFKDDTTPGNGKQPPKPNNNGNQNQNQKEKEKKSKAIQLIANIHKSLYLYPMSLVEPVSGESETKPLVARWESKKEAFYKAYSTKYGETVKVILDILMHHNCQNSDWNEMVMEKSKSRKTLLDMISDIS